MIDRGHTLPLIRQAAVLGISRGSLYHSACPVPPAELAIMRRIDELHLDYPFAGSRMLRDLLRGEGIEIGRDQVRTMMRRMAIEAVYRRPHTSKPTDGHKVFPYLLRGLSIERVNQVWAMDITYIPMAVASCTWPRCWTGSAGAYWLGGYRSPWRSISAWMQLTMRWPGTVGRRFSTPTRAASSPVRRSPGCCRTTRSKSAWTDEGLGATTCSSSGCGVR